MDEGFVSAAVPAQAVTRVLPLPSTQHTQVTGAD